MDRRSAILTIVFAGLLCSALIAQAQEVRILQPTDGDIVRGVVTVQGEKPNPEEGYITVAVRDAQGQENLVGAAIAPFKVRWDSRERDEKGGRRYPDGQYSLVVTGHSGSGEKVGQTAVLVTVANDVEDPAAATGIVLRYKFARNDRMDYELTGRSKLRVAEDKDLKSKDKMKVYLAQQRQWMGEQQKMQMTYLELESVVEWSESVIGVAEGGGGVVRKSASNGWLDFGTGIPQMISQVGRTFTLFIRPNGRQEPKRPGDPTLTWGNQTIELPADPVKVGDSWNSALGFIPHDLVYHDPEKSGAIFKEARHTLEGFEWNSGYKCARIRSTFKYSGPVVLLNGFRFTTDMTGERVTYFAYEQGKMVGFTERLEHEFELPATGMMGGAMPGTPGLPGAMGPAGAPAVGLPGMGPMPGLEVPGAPPGTLGPGLPGMPGVPGMEMPGMPGMPPGMGAVPGGMPGTPGMPPGMPMGGMPGMQMPGMPPGPAGMPGMEVPGLPGMPGGAGMGAMPGAPGMPAMPGMPGMGVPGVPGMPGMPPGVGAAPGTPPGAGAVPGVPGVPGMPGMPGAPGTPGMQGLPGMGAAYQAVQPPKFKLIVEHKVGVPLREAAPPARQKRGSAGTSAVSVVP